MTSNISLVKNENKKFIKRIREKDYNVPEYTIIAFLKKADQIKFIRNTERFPKSLIEQLPPHLTILNMIFSTEKADIIISEIENILKNLNIPPFIIHTGNINIWYNSTYQGYSIAVSIEPNDELLNLRTELEKVLMPITIPEEKSIWSDFMPHITISLRVDSETAKRAKNLKIPMGRRYSIQTIDLLRHGGNYFGYQKIKRFKINKRGTQP